MVIAEPEHVEIPAISSPASSQARATPTAQTMAPPPPLAPIPTFLPANAGTSSGAKAGKISPSISGGPSGDIRRCAPRKNQK